MMRTPDGHSRLALSRFLTPPVVADHRSAPVNVLGYLRCSPSTTATGRLKSFPIAARSSSAKSSIIKTCVGSATFAGLAGFSLDSHRNSAERHTSARVSRRVDQRRSSSRITQATSLSASASMRVAETSRHSLRSNGGKKTSASRSASTSVSVMWVARARPAA